MNGGIETYHFGHDRIAIDIIRFAFPPLIDADKDALILLLETTFSVNALTRTWRSNSTALVITDQPRLCLAALHAALGRLMKTVMTGSEAERVGKVYEILTQHPDLVDSLVSWVFRIDSPGSFVALETSLETCSCGRLSDPLVPGLHTGYQLVSHPSFYSPLVEDIFAFLAKIVEGLTPAKFAKLIEKNKQKVRDRGYRALVGAIAEGLAYRSCVAWFLRHPTSAGIGFLFSLAKHLPSAFQSSVLVDPEPLGHTTRQFFELFQLAQRHEHVYDSINLILHQGALFLHSLTMPNQLPIGNRRTLFRSPVGKRMYLTIALTLKLMDQASFDGCDLLKENPGVMTMLAEVGSYIYGSHLMKMEPRSRGSLKYESVIDTYYQDQQSYIDTLYCANLWSLIDQLKRGRRCLNITCGKLPTNAYDAHPKCTKCGLVSYCSETCQRTAWSASHIAHRDMCSVLYTMSAIWPETWDDMTKELILLAIKGRTAISASQAVTPLTSLESAELQYRLSHDLTAHKRVRATSVQRHADMDVILRIKLDGAESTVVQLEKTTRLALAFEDLVEVVWGGF